jgi:ABC-type spermidine/putrescine transport system permease subunit II
MKKSESTVVNVIVGIVFVVLMLPIAIIMILSFIGRLVLGIGKLTSENKEK